MKFIFKKGDEKKFHKIVLSDDFATFESGNVHEVYATFSIARDAEWCGRLFVLDMKDENEEGIGVSLSIEHICPAFENEEVEITSYFEEINEKKEIVTLFELKVGERLIAKGVQKQRILLKTKIQKIFENIKES